MIAQLNDMAQIWWQWMAGMFWQVSLFIILVTLLDMAIRRWAWPQVRYVLWGLVFLKLIIPPTWQMPTSIVSWIQPQVEEQIYIQITPQKIFASSMPSPTQITAPVVTTEKASWQAIVLLTWLSGMITFGLMLVIKMSRLPKGSKMQDEQNAPEWFHELLAKTARRLNLKKIPAIVFSRDTKSPAVYGIFRPVLLLPEGCLDQLSQEQVEHVLIHELCHLKRGDLLVHWFCLLLQIVYWFNPLLIWTRRQMRHVCEICCDLSVADVLREKTMAYRETLLATARELLTKTVEPGLGLLGVFEEPFRLVSRLKWLEKKTWENRKRKIAATICTSLIMIICVMPMAGLSQPSAQDNDLRADSEPEYMIGIEYDSQPTGIYESKVLQTQGDKVVSRSLIHYETLIMEANADKDLDLGAQWIGPPPGSQIENGNTSKNDFYAERVALNPGSPIDEGGLITKNLLDMERIGPGPFQTDEDGFIIIPSTPPDTSANQSEGEVGATEASNPLPSYIISTGLFKKDITIGAESFPDIPAVTKSMKTASDVYIVGTPQMVTPNNVETKKVFSRGETNTSKLSIKITPKIIKDRLINQTVILGILRSAEEKSKGVLPIAIAQNFNIEEGSTMVMIYSPRGDNGMAEKNSTDGKKYYVFLTSHIENP